MIAIAFLRLNI